MACEEGGVDGIDGVGWSAARVLSDAASGCRQEDGAASLGFALSLDRMVPRLEAALWKL